MQGSCDGFSIVFVVIFKRIISIVQIIAPILAIIAGTIVFIKFVTNPEDKKLTKKLINSIIALVMVFFISLITGVIINMVTEHSSLKSCLEKATNYNLERNTSYEDVYNQSDSKKQFVLPDADEYEKGNKAGAILPKNASILFIGNSFSQNGITQGVVDIGKQLGFSVSYQFAQKGGSKLYDVYNHGNNKSIIKNHRYDAVILQPDYIEQDKSNNNKTGAIKTVNDVKANNPNAIVYYRKIWDYKSTSKSKVNKLQKMYTDLMNDLEKELNIPLIPIEDGISMHEAVWNYNINVFSSDNYHQNATGVYLIDYCIASVVFGVDPTTLGDFKIANHGQLDHSTATKLKAIAKKNCYKS